MVWFQRGYRARGLSWRSGVVLHDSWCLGDGFNCRNGLVVLASSGDQVSCCTTFRNLNAIN